MKIIRFDYLTFHLTKTALAIGANKSLAKKKKLLKNDLENELLQGDFENLV